MLCRLCKNSFVMRIYSLLFSILHLRHFSKGNKYCLTAREMLVPWDHKIVYGNDTVIDQCVGAGRLLLALVQRVKAA